MSFYNKVYNFTNENVTCLKDIYSFENSKVLSVVGSGDQYFASMLFGAKQVDLFDINETSYLYFILKFYSIRELTFNEFYEFLVLKNFNNINIYNKLEKVLPIKVLKYYKFLIITTKFSKAKYFKEDGVDLTTKKSQRYYFKNIDTVIPYFIEEKYYKLQSILKNTKLPNFYESDILKLTPNEKYDVLITSNIYYHTPLYIFNYVEFLKKLDIPQIQAGYDWYGVDMPEFLYVGCRVSKVLPAAPQQFDRNKNFIYSIKR